MKDKTRELWRLQDRHPGDRSRLFRAIGDWKPPDTVLYPGSYCDVAPSFVFPSVTYVDTDKRAAAFFGDAEGVRQIIRRQEGAPDKPEVRFIQSDYTKELDLPEQSFDLLISLYGGFVSESCTRYLRVGGMFLVNPSHGDAAMASIDPRYRLSAVALTRPNGYRVSANKLAEYLVPKEPIEITKELLHRTGRGIGYTKPAFAYLFERVI